jgi:predicted lipoprotein with Yx(FWY)xxD motif
VKHTRVVGVAATALALLIAGCGSSGSSTTTAASTPATSTAAQTVAASTSTSPAPTAGVVVSTKPGKLGTVLAAGPKHLTVYLFEADKGSSSTCNGACAKVWPPVSTTGNPQAGGGAISADLGTTTRSDGTKQVTYKGHPLYFFTRDDDSGDAYGQGSTSFGAGWYVLKPNGSKVDDDDDDDGGDNS